VKARRAPTMKRPSYWSPPMLDLLGWVATAIFASSYFCKRSITLRIMQAVAAVVWMGYGIIIHALPIIVANISVAFMAGYSAWRERENLSGDASPGLREQIGVSEAKPITGKR